MIQSAATGNAEGQYTHRRFVPVRSGVVNGSTPPARLLLQGIPKAAYTPEERKPELLDQVRHVIRLRHYSYQTEK